MRTIFISFSSLSIFTVSFYSPTAYFSPVKLLSLPVLVTVVLFPSMHSVCLPWAGSLTSWNWSCGLFCSHFQKPFSFNSKHHFFTSLWVVISHPHYFCLKDFSVWFNLSTELITRRDLGFILLPYYLHCFPPTRGCCSLPEVLSMVFEVMMPSCVQQHYLDFRAGVHLVEEGLGLVDYSW